MAILDKTGKSKAVDIEQILRSIHFRDLEIFEAVSRHASISAASRELQLQVPHISKSLKRIETAAHQQFFVRSKTGVMLTVEGRRFLDFAQNFSKLISNTDWTNSSVPTHEKQKLVAIGGSSFLVSHLITKALEEPYLDQNFRYRLVEIGETLLVGSAIKNTCEIAIHLKKLDFPKSWSTVEVGKLSWVLCARMGHPLSPVTSEPQVKKYPFVTPVLLNGREYRHGEDHCPLTPRNRILGDEALTAETALNRVEVSNQLAFVPEIMIQDRIQLGRLKKIQVREWPQVKDSLFLSVQSDSVSQKLFDHLIQACEKFSI